MPDSKNPPAPLPHQQEGIRFLQERTAAALFDEQGLGKSKQLIEAVSQSISSGELSGALIICPNSLKTTWGEEIEQHSSLRYALFGAGKKARRDTFRSLTASIYVINYEAVASELPSLKALLRFKRMALVLDESHRIKTPDAKVTRAILQLRTDAARRYIMSGTPVANKPDDLWSQMLFLDDGDALGVAFEDFRMRYCSPNGGYTNLEDLRERIGHISLRREKEGTLPLPPKTVVRVPVSLAGEQLRLYETLRNELAVWVESMSGEQILAEAEAILARLVRLAQLASDPRLLDAGYQEAPAKYSVMDGIIGGHLESPDRKAIIWTSFVPNIDRLCERYRQYSPVTLYGEMNRSQRDAAVSSFRTNPSVRLMIANPAAAREGLTLTSANLAVYLDRTFNLVDFLQSQDRIHRISQSSPCEIILLIAENTIDEFIDFSLAQKHRLARFTQGDVSTIDDSDLALQKPDVLRALLGS